jgi:hypothetical protein
MSCQVFTDFILFYLLFNIGFIFWFHHHAVSFVCSRISDQPTALIFWVTKLIQVDAEVRQVTNVHFIGSFEGVWPITTTEGARVDGACPNRWELRIPRTDFSGPQQMGLCENSTNSGRWMEA